MRFLHIFLEFAAKPPHINADDWCCPVVQAADGWSCPIGPPAGDTSETSSAPEADAAEIALFIVGPWN